jgi:hypothetical protein
MQRSTRCPCDLLGCSSSHQCRRPIFAQWVERAERRWREMNQDEKALLTGLDLTRAEEWLPTRGQDLASDVTAFIQQLLRQSQQHMSEEFIDIYGNYAIKLLRLQGEMIQTFDRYRRGNKQTVEVRHVHIHSGGQGVVGIINAPGDREEGGGQE